MRRSIFKLRLSLVLILTFSFNNVFSQSKTEKQTKVFPIPEEGSFNFFVIGDWGRNGDYNQKEVAASMSKTAKLIDPEFIISTGDNFYTYGVASINDPQWKYSYEEVYTGADLNRPWYVVLGNHDYRGNPQAEIDYTKISRRWNMPSRYFTFANETDDKKNVRFIFIDTNPYVKKYYRESENYSDLAKQDTAMQSKWLDSLLASSKEEWKFVIGHHPVYSSSPKHGNTVELFSTLKPKLEKYGVQLYFAGHEHDLQHQKPEGNVDYIVSGSGSEVRKTGKFPSITKFAQSTPGFAWVSIKNNKLKLYFIDQNGNVIYQFERGL